MANAGNGLSGRNLWRGVVGAVRCSICRIFDFGLDVSSGKVVIAYRSSGASPQPLLLPE